VTARPPVALAVSAATRLDYRKERLVPDLRITTDATRVCHVIFEYASRIARECDRETLIGIIGDMGRDLVGADRCTIWLIDRTAQALVARFAHGTHLRPIGVDQGLVGRCVATGEVILSNSVRDEPRFSPVVDQQTGYTTASVLTVPMRTADGSIMGAVQAINKPGGFVASDADLLQLVAAYSARTIETQTLLREAETARLVARDLAIAREVQQRLLAKPHRHRGGGLEFAGFCRPAAEVGGDYYDLIPLPNDGVAIAVGDVSGKGIAAALMMASVQATLHGLVARGPLRPANLLTQLNLAIVEAATGQYLTLFLALYDPHARTLIAANAGHVHPVLLGRGGTPHDLAAGGPPLGLFPDVRYDEEEWTLQPGDKLVCYSDGLSEAHDEDGHFWGECGFRDTVLTAAHLRASETVAHVMRHADAFTGSAPPSDDMTLVCLRVPDSADSGTDCALEHGDSLPR
jgi:phosphoserine phosphatase RsbU/P